MTNTNYADPGNFFNLDYSPQPTQDSDLLKQLGFIPGLKEILMLRQVHALEHGTVWVLSEREKKFETGILEGNKPKIDNETLGGLSTDRGFYLYGRVDRLDLKRAVYQALDRLKLGEWNLAIHPRCGTNLSVAMLLTSGLVLGTHLLLPRLPLTQLFGAGIAATTAANLAPDLGKEAQRYLTTSIPFNLQIKDISSTTDLWGRSAYFVSVEWYSCNKT